MFIFVYFHLIYILKVFSTFFNCKVFDQILKINLNNTSASILSSDGIQPALLHSCSDGIFNTSTEKMNIQLSNL